MPVAGTPTALPPTEPRPTPGPPTPERSADSGRQLPARVAALQLERNLDLDLTDFTGQESPDEVYVGAVGADDQRIGVSLNIQGAFAEWPTTKKSSRAVDEFFSCSRDDYATCSVSKSDDEIALLYRSSKDGYRHIGADLLQVDGTRVVLSVAYPDSGRYRVSVKKVARAANLLGPELYAPPSADDVAEAEEQVVPWTLLDESATEEPDPSPTDDPGEFSGPLTARLAALYVSRMTPGEAVEFYGYESKNALTAIAMIDHGDPVEPGKAAARVVVDTAAKTIPDCSDPELDGCEISNPSPGVQLRADNTLVTVTGGNSASFRAGHPRPGTSLEQLTAIALDEDAWDVQAEPKASDATAAEQLEPYIAMNGPDDF